MGFENLAKKVTCCYECQNRYPACHDSCEKYQTERAEYLEKKDAINKERLKQKGFDTWKIQMVKQTKARGRIHSNNSSMVNHKSHIRNKEN